MTAEQKVDALLEADGSVKQFIASVSTPEEIDAEAEKDTLSEYLKERSAEICRDNECTEADHNCQSYAYVNANMRLVDICCPDYFQGGDAAAICLPWTGTQADLEDEVRSQCGELAEEGE